MRRQTHDVVGIILLVAAVIGVSIAAVFIFWVLPFNPPSDGRLDRYFYLLSSLAQGLAAVLAIVFTLSLVGAQLSAKYTQRTIGHFFNWHTIALMGLFVLATVLPLSLLPAVDKVDAVWAKICLFLGITGLILLLPYFWSLKSRLSVEYLLNDLARKAAGSLKAEARHPRDLSWDFPNEIKAIDNISLAAFRDNDYDTFELGVGHLAQLMAVDFVAGSELNKRLRDISLIVLNDPRASIIVIRRFSVANFGVLSNGGNNLTNQIVSSLETVGRKAIRGALTEQALEVCDCFERCGTDMVRLQGSGATKAVTYLCLMLGRLGEEACKTAMSDVGARSLGALSMVLNKLISVEGGPSNLTPEVFHPFVRFGDETMSHGLDEIAKSICLHLRDLGVLAAQRQQAACCSEVAACLWLMGAVFQHWRPSLRPKAVEALRGLQGAAPDGAVMAESFSKATNLRPRILEQVSDSALRDFSLFYKSA